MSSAAAGWYLDPSTGTNLRLWNGSTWTDEVAPLSSGAPSGGAPHSDTPPSDAQRSDTQHSDTRASDTRASDTRASGRLSAEYAFDSDLEHTQLSRRELRARRGSDAELNDAPRHLPLIAPPPPVAAPPAEPPENLELVIPAEPSAVGHTRRPRRNGIIRLALLLGVLLVLAVVSSIGLLTAGSL